MIQTEFLWTASDPTYAAVNGEDLLPDLAIGRLPAANPDELRAMVHKILDYETSERGPPAPTVLVADREDLAGNFERHAFELASNLLAPRRPELILAGRLGVDASREAIHAAFNRGASLVSYIGHGGIHLWASGGLLSVDQVSQLEPQSRQPLVLTLNCLNGYFHFPYFNSLAEALIQADGKGAIAVISPSGLSLDAPAHQLHRALLEALVNNEGGRLGDVFLEAQESFVATGAHPALLSIYHLFGDPAMRVR